VKRLVSIARIAFFILLTSFGLSETVEGLWLYYSAAIGKVLLLLYKSNR
jgi:hypothetical protein